MHNRMMSALAMWHLLYRQLVALSPRTVSWSLVRQRWTNPGRCTTSLRGSQRGHGEFHDNQRFNISGWITIPAGNGEFMR